MKASQNQDEDQVQISDPSASESPADDVKQTTANNVIDSNNHNDGTPSPKPSSIWRKTLSTIKYIPPWCRWDPANPPVFNIWHNIMFAFAGAFTVANLYYNHPILNILAEDFGVSYVEVSNIPTLAQGGYATGLVFLCPLGEFFLK